MTTPSHHYLQSTLTNTTSGLGSNSYTTDRSSSLSNSLKNKYSENTESFYPNNLYGEATNYDLNSFGSKGKYFS